MSNKVPDLRFGPGTSGGFTPAGIAAFDNLRPAAVVRELIQNSLDAAKEAEVTPAIVRFELNRMPRHSVPGIQSYKSAFAKAVATQKNMTGGILASQAQRVVHTIGDALNQNELDVLSALDNGIGLNEQRMNALLSDGLSVKAGGATGTYGNGHATAIPASNLRYILYGGITQNGQKIGAGHAVLASHMREGEQHLRAGDGFYITDFCAGHKTLYSYATGEDVPSLIAEAINSVNDVSPHGTAVIIPAFNNFLEGQPLWDMVSHAASANFFVAIEEGELEVRFQDNRNRVIGISSSATLDQSTLRAVLKAHRDKKKAAAFLNGRRAFEAHLAYYSGNRHRITTSAGQIDIRLRENPSGITRVDLCRNGMWITDKIPGFHQKFVDQVPFHAILSLNAQEGGVLYDLIRVAEGPLHDSINMKRLEEEDRRECRNALREVIKWILSHTRQVETDSFFSPDFLTLDFGDEHGSGHGNSGKVFWGRPVPVSKNPARQLRLFSIDSGTSDDDHPGGRRKKKKSKKRNLSHRRVRPSLPTFFQAVSCPIGRNRRRIVIKCFKDCSDAELRLAVDEALDATCERPGQDAYAPAVLSNIQINGNGASDTDLVRWEDGVVGVRLGDLTADALVQVEADYQLAGDFGDLSNPSLRVEIFKTERDSKQTKATK